MGKFNLELLESRRHLNAVINDEGYHAALYVDLWDSPSDPQTCVGVLKIEYGAIGYCGMPKNLRQGVFSVPGYVHLQYFPGGSAYASPLVKGYKIISQPDDDMAVIGQILRTPGAPDVGALISDTKRGDDFWFQGSGIFDTYKVLSCNCYTFVASTANMYRYLGNNGAFDIFGSPAPDEQGFIVDATGAEHEIYPMPADGTLLGSEVRHYDNWMRAHADDPNSFAFGYGNLPDGAGGAYFDLGPSTPPPPSAAGAAQASLSGTLRLEGDQVVLDDGNLPLFEEYLDDTGPLLIGAADNTQPLFLNIDLSGGNPVPSGSVAFNAGSSGEISFTHVGGSSAVASLTPTSLAFADGTVVSLSSVDTIDIQSSDPANLPIAGLDPSSDIQVSPSEIQLGDLTVNTSNFSKVVLDAQAGTKISLNSLSVSGRAVLAPGKNLTLDVNALQVTGDGQLDLEDNTLIVNYTGTSPEASIRSNIANAIDGGSWDAPGITSSLAAADPNFDTGIGYCEASDLGYANGGTFDGVTIPGQAVLVKYTYYGDNNLDGVVNLDDFSIFIDGYNGLGSGWVYGDYNYNNVINQDDFSLFINGYNQTGGSLSTLAPQAESYLGLSPLQYQIDVSNASLVSSFGTDGKVVTNLFGYRDVLETVATTPDGHILAAGYTEGALWQFAIVEYNPDGTLDTSFGTNGIVRTGFGSYADLAQTLLVVPDGDSFKFYVAGYDNTNGGSPAYWDIAVARYNADGSLDTTWNGTGKVLTDAGGGGPTYLAQHYMALAVDSSGKLLLAAGNNGDVLLMRYLTSGSSAGSLDTSFNSGGGVPGIVTTDLGGYYYGHTIAVQSNGQIVVGADEPAISQGQPNNLAAVRYNSDGTLDTTFGNGALVGGGATSGGGAWIGQFYTSSSFLEGLVLENDGKIVLGGIGFMPISGSSTWSYQPSLLRLTSSGVTDTTFGSSGLAKVYLGAGLWNGAGTFGMDANGDFVLTMPLMMGTTSPDTGEFFTVKFTSAGALDTSFADGGVAVGDFGYKDASVALAFASNGDIIVAGTSDKLDGWGEDFALMEYL